ncbi:MAG: ROK family protein [Stellaceae bacterium]
MRKEEEPTTLAIDVGGTGVKAALLDAKGRMASERLRVPTPNPCRPDVLLGTIDALAKQLTSFDRVSVGFPGVVRAGRIVTAPHFGTEDWRGEDFAAALTRRLGKPVRILNDAEVQGLGIVKRTGLEVVLTLGTGLGSAIFSDGGLAPHIELAHIPVTRRKTYNDYIGDSSLKSIGKKRWNRRVLRVIAIVETLLNYDLLYLGGGNSRHVEPNLPANVRISGNDAGLTGGIHLWDDAIWNAVPTGQGRREPRRAAAS